MRNRGRTTLLLNCSQAEASRIRAAAARQRQTISGYILNIVMRAIKFDDSLARLRELGADARIPIRGMDAYGLEGLTRRPSGPRTTMLLSCSVDDTRLIRVAAKRREIPICRLVLHAIHRSWAVTERQNPHLRTSQFLQE